MQLYCLNTGGGPESASVRKFEHSDEFVFRGHEGSINDIAWAPLAGRSFHLIATAATDRRILIWKLRTQNALFASLFGQPEP